MVTKTLPGAPSHFRPEVPLPLVWEAAVTQKVPGEVTEVVERPSAIDGKGEGEEEESEEEE